MEADLDRLREIADALDDARGGAAVALISEANDIISRHIVKHERDDEANVYPDLAKYLSGGPGLGAMAGLTGRSSILRVFWDSSPVGLTLRTPIGT